MKLTSYVNFVKTNPNQFSYMVLVLK